MWGILHFVVPSDRLCHRYSPLTPSLCLSSLYLKFTTLIYVAVLFFSRWIHIPLWNIHLQVSVWRVGKFSHALFPGNTEQPTSPYLSSLCVVHSNCLWGIVLRFLHQSCFGGSKLCSRYFTSAIHLSTLSLQPFFMWLFCFSLLEFTYRFETYTCK